MHSRGVFQVTAGPYSLQLGKRTQVMGIINLTPDSFSGDGCLSDIRDGSRRAVGLARKFIREGADILDVGAESSRPGARRIPAKEEINRILSVIRRLVRECPVPISIDTYKPLVAKYALDEGVAIVNCIEGVHPDESLLRMVRDYNAAIVLMHMRATPRTMQKNIYYKDLLGEITAELRRSIEKCLEIGIKSDRIIIDPGIGFGKIAEHNLEIINRLEILKKLKKPILLGASRKSFIGKVLKGDVSHRLLGSLASVCAGILNGAHIVRVHDVGPTKEVATMMDAILNERIIYGARSAT